MSVIFKNPFSDDSDDLNEDIDPSIIEAANELKQELINEQLAGHKKWSSDTKVIITLEKIKKLESLIEKFDNKCNEIRARYENIANNKIDNLRKNWQIDSKLSEIESLKNAIREHFIDEEI